MKKVELSDFQRKFLAQGTGQTLFTAKEFEEALAQAKGEIMAIAIQTSKQAVYIERRACAELVDAAGHPELAQQILNRIPGQFQ